MREREGGEAQIVTEMRSEDWKEAEEKRSLGWAFNPEDSGNNNDDDDEYPTMGVQFLRLKPKVSACSFCLDLIALRIDEPLILSVGSKWI